MSRATTHRAVRNACVFVALLGAFTITAQAEEKIVGAFGMRLGDTFYPESAIGKGALTDGTPMYQFAPKKRFRSFNRYYVMITPKTHRIYSIWAIGPVENTEVGEKEQAVIMTLLERKYGKKEKEGLFDALMDAKQVDQGNRYAMVKVSGFMDVTIDIRYYDKKLSDLAEKERVALEAEKVDDSGL